MDGVKDNSRRSLLKCALATLGSLAAPVADVASPPARSGAEYQVADRRDLIGGGIGLFVVVPPTLTAQDLKDLGGRLHAQFDDQPVVVVEIFDDLGAAKTVREGSRVVGEERFASAKARQRASYSKNARSGRSVLTIYGETPETIVY